MTEIAVREENLPVPADATSPLIRWAIDARQAHQIAQSLARTNFVPASMKGKPDEVTAAILTGQELGLDPMASLRSIDVIEGTPAMRAHAIRGLVQSRGHEVWVKESTDTRAIVCGKRKGAEDVQQSVWTTARAEKMGLAGKSNWKRMPQAMLVARATAEVCRLIAADVLLGMPYAVEELDADLPEAIVGREPKRKAQRKPVEPTPMPEPEFVAPDEVDPEPIGDTLPEPQTWDEPWPEPAQPPLESGDAAS